MKEGVGSGVESGFESIVRGTDPDPHQNVMDPQHCFKGSWRNGAGRELAIFG